MKTLLAIISLFIAASILAYAADKMDITYTFNYFFSLLTLVVVFVQLEELRGKK